MTKCHHHGSWLVLFRSEINQECYGEMGNFGNLHVYGHLLPGTAVSVHCAVWVDQRHH